MKVDERAIHLQYFYKYFKVLQAETDSQLQDVVTQAASLISVAGHNVRITLEHKEETASDLAHWYVLQRTRAPFERYIYDVVYTVSIPKQKNVVESHQSIFIYKVLFMQGEVTQRALQLI